VTPRKTAVVALLAAGALLGRPGPSAALDPRKSISQYGHDVWQVEDGLPQNTVKVIRQTRDGYLWLGTEEGLVRFDGVRFAVFDSTSVPEMRISFVTSLLEDAAGTLWIGTNGGGLLSYRGGRFAAYGLADKPALQVSALASAGPEGPWLAAGDVGLLQMKAGTLVRRPGNDRLPLSEVFVLHRDRQGTLWIGTRSNGLVSIRDGEARQYTVRNGLSDDHVWALADGADGSVWVGTDKGLSHLAHDGAITNTILDESVRAILEDRHGNLWVGSNDRGLRRLRDGQWLRFGTADGLSNDTVWALYEDREGSLWVGTNGGGLNRFRDGALTAIGTQEGLSSELIRSVYQHPDGALWIGTKGGGANRIKDGKITVLTPGSGLSEDTVVSFSADRDGALWLGTVRGGLNRWKDGKVTVYRKADGLPDDSVFALLGRADGSLWIGHRGGGLSRLLDGKFTHYGEPEGLHNPYVWTIVEGKDGTLWIGASGGLYAHDAGGIRLVIPDISPHAIHVDAEGVVWAGTTTDGLYRYKDGRPTAFTVRQGLFDNRVSGILEDAHGNLWMSCNKGIFSVSKRQLADVAEGRMPTVVSVPYDTADGMRSRECGYGSSWKTTDGRLCFPTIRGVVIVDPENLQKNALPPPVVIEEVVGNGRSLSVEPGRPLELPPGEGRLHFRYTALSLRAPKKVRFAYRLDGLEDNWVEAGPTREATYANLRPSRYTFRVRACNNDGVWNESGASVRLHLQPHFYQTGWFYGLCVAGIAFAGWQGHRFRLRRVIEMERVRTRIASDLHDDVGSGLSQIALLTGVARTQLDQDGARASDSLTQIAGTAEGLVDSMSDIVWAMNPGKDHMEDLVHRMRRFASDVLGARDIALDFRVDGLQPALAVTPDFRRHVYLIFKESVNNAAKHSGCGRVAVALTVMDHHLRLEIKDDGKGFASAPSGDGYGLETLTRRARDLGGWLTIASRPDEGTAVTAQLPLVRRARRPWDRLVSRWKESAGSEPK
jgi:ligand-binding sensor domain-containing protein/signal transduction histidine kinase